ncbi:M56 family metallopeptidase [Kitasatospora cathayae]|uniref:M56 family metallopeptidase n=1 Tax=Kitasatospora cathayae TaxID=3004092 RepID=A0ABY7PXG2_9ACTN|nr:M56 family metallopeptidase [Kitasatospora sp. HUAS 3-15]WBP85099.1 M56 family metallopeptidase [Kitasatospora sp. HUAS 3-15]
MTALAALALAAYAALVGAGLPPLLARAAWTRRSPALALAAWYGLAVTFTVSCALAAYHLVLSGSHTHGLLGLFEPGSPTAPEGPTILLPVAAGMAWPLASVAAAGHRARRDRAAHLDKLALAGRFDEELDAMLLDHPIPVAYCLPRGPVVVSSGALCALTSGQLGAALLHERAHLSGRHHLLLTVSSGLADAFWKLPLAHGLRTHTAVLLEMMADDRAARTSSAEDLATAICEVASPERSAVTLAAGGGTSTILRMRRLLRPEPRIRPALQLAVLMLITLGPALPYLLTCGPTPR